MPCIIFQVKVETLETQNFFSCRTSRKWKYHAYRERFQSHEVLSLNSAFFNFQTMYVWEKIHHLTLCILQVCWCQKGVRVTVCKESWHKAMTRLLQRIWCLTANRIGTTKQIWQEKNWLLKYISHYASIYR